MDVKGSVLQSVPKFIRARFGDEGLQRWLDALDGECRTLFTGPILPSGWYPVQVSLVGPTVLLCELFYNGDVRGAWESGRFSAEDGLRGIYRVFVRLGSPHFIISKGATIMKTLYRPSEITVTEPVGTTTTVRITQFPEPHPVLDARIGGWIEQALLVCGCPTVKVAASHLMTRGDVFTEYKVSWT
jgi:hypothetical protein